MRFAASNIARAAGVALLFAGLVARSGGHASAGDLTFPNVEQAYEQGVSGVRSGRLELAATAFEYAAERNHVPSTYYLAKIYANNTSSLTDHARAFALFGQLVERYAYIDPLYDFRSAFVARAFVALAKYYQSGLPALRQPADSRQAVELLRHAANYFGDREAQFELAKMLLTGEGMREDSRLGLHYLSTLTRQGHPGAQAFLADLYWRGKYVQRDPARALALSRMAGQAAGEQDRIWIDEIHQMIFCGAPSGVRQQAGHYVAEWHRRAPEAADNGGQRGPSVGLEQRLGQSSGAQLPEAVRTCADGTAVETLRGLDAKPASPGVNGNPASGTIDAGLIIDRSRPAVTEKPRP